MGRKVVLVACRKCGNQARKINYVSSSKGRTYHYYKYVHSNGVIHYFRQTARLSNADSSVPPLRASTFDSLEEIVAVKMGAKEMRFGEIKSLLENSYGKKVSAATIYRNINKLLKLDLISKRVDGDVVLYRRKVDGLSTREIQTSEMSVGFDFTKDKISVTMFVKVKNSGIGLVTGYTISLPVGGLDTLDKINLTAFDQTKKIPLSRKNISYTSSDRTGISISLNRALRKMEEEHLFLNYIHRFQNRPIKMVIPSNIDVLRINCEIKKGQEIVIKKLLSDGLKEIEPIIVKRTASDLGDVVVETVFENVIRGDTVVISLDK